MPRGEGEELVQKVGRLDAGAEREAEARKRGGEAIADAGAEVEYLLVQGRMDEEFHVLYVDVLVKG